MRLYFIAFDGINSNHRRETGFYERDTDRMSLNNTVNDLISGEWQDPAAVYEADAVVGTWLDASEDVINLIVARCEDQRQPIPRHLAPFIERNIGVDEAARLFEREAA